MPVTQQRTDDIIKQLSPYRLNTSAVLKAANEARLKLEGDQRTWADHASREHAEQCQKLLNESFKESKAKGVKSDLLKEADIAYTKDLMRGGCESVLEAMEKAGATIPYDKVTFDDLYNADSVVFLHKKGYDFNEAQVINGKRVTFPEYIKGKMLETHDKVFDKFEEVRKWGAQHITSKQVLDEYVQELKTASADRKARIRAEAPLLDYLYAEAEENLGKTLKEGDVLLNHCSKYNLMRLYAVDYDCVNAKNAQALKSQIFKDISDDIEQVNSFRDKTVNYYNDAGGASLEKAEQNLKKAGYTVEEAHKYASMVGISLGANNAAKTNLTANKNNLFSQELRSVLKNAPAPKGLSGTIAKAANQPAGKTEETVKSSPVLGSKVSDTAENSSSQPQRKQENSASA